MTTAAAAEIIRVSIEDGVSAAALESGTDKATISRLVHARYRSHLRDSRRPAIARIVTLASGKFCVANAVSGEVAAVFAPTDEDLMVRWLSTPDAAVLLPDMQCLPKAANWSDRFKVVIHRSLFRELFASPVRQSATRMAAFLDVSKQSRPAVASFLADEIHGNAGLDGQAWIDLFRPGSAARQFIRMRERVEGFAFVEAVGQGNLTIEHWQASCEGEWREIFSPVLRTIATYRDQMFNHPACVSELPDPAQCAASSSAALMTLSTAA